MRCGEGCVAWTCSIQIVIDIFSILGTFHMVYGIRSWELMFIVLMESE